MVLLVLAYLTHALFSVNRLIVLLAVGSRAI
jgi:hypothetical protein